MLSEGDEQQCRLSFGDPRRGRGESPYQFYAFYEFLCKYRQVEQKHVFDSLMPHYAALTSTSVLPLQCLSPASELHTRRWGGGESFLCFSSLQDLLEHLCHSAPAQRAALCDVTRCSARVVTTPSSSSCSVF